MSKPDDAPSAPRGRGRPPLGQRVHVHLPDPLLADVDRIAADGAMRRAEVIRELLGEAIKARKRRR